jgi:hypothetical protein
MTVSFQNIFNNYSLNNQPVSELLQVTDTAATNTKIYKQANTQ